MEEQITDNVTETEEASNKTMTFDEMLSSNKDYQAEFDRRLAKSNNTFLENKKSEWEKEYNEKLAKEKSEDEKLAKMNVEQQLKYQIDQLKQEIADRDSKINASQLKDETSKILIEKGIPNSYLNMFDFSKENADTINSKLEMLSNIRNQDIQDSLNKTLRQSSPKYVKQESEDEIDPYIEGFMSEL